jgi:hypothetical protein
MTRRFVCQRNGVRLKDTIAAKDRSLVDCAASGEDVIFRAEMGEYFRPTRNQYLRPRHEMKRSPDGLWAIQLLS